MRHTLMLVAATGALVAIVHALRSFYAQRAARAVIAAFAARVAPPSAGKVILRGVWRGPSLQTTVLADDRLICAGADGAWLDCDGERVELAGDVRVVLGADCEHFHFRPSGPIRVMSIADGDRVIVAGTASQMADAESTYRDSAASWTVSAGRFSPMLVVAEAPVSRPAPLALFGLLALPTALGAFAYCVLRIATT